MEFQRFSFVGKRIPPRGAKDKCTGAVKYPSDIQLPGMLYAKVLRSPHAHARIKRIDASRAEQYPGVYSTLTYRDVPSAAITIGKSPYLLDVFYTCERRILDSTVRFVGDYVAAVAAVDEDAAEDALSLIDVEYEELPPVFDPEVAALPDAPQLYPGGNVFGGSSDKPTLEYARGDVEKGFREADRILERKYTLPFTNATPMEPRGCVAVWEGDKLTVWDSTQVPYKIQEDISRIIGIPKEDVRVIASTIGGGYGNKGSSHPYEFIALLLAQRAKRPVKLWFTREEETVAGIQRPSCNIYLKVGAKFDGAITAIHFKTLYNTGSWLPHDVGIVHHMARIPMCIYDRVPNAKFESYVVFTNLPAVGGYRSFGSAEAHLALECMMDEVAHELGLDPIEVRMRNHAQPGDDLSPMFPGLRMSSVGVDECMTRGAERIGWERRGKVPGSGLDIKKRGIGMAIGSHTGGLRRPPMNSQVELETSGEIILKIGTPDIGTEPTTAQTQIAAEVLGAAFEDVVVFNADTKDDVFDYGIFASKTISGQGLATVRACEEVKKQIFSVASEMLEIAPQDLEALDSVVYAKGAPRRRVSFGEVARRAAATGRRVIGRGTFNEAFENVFAFTSGFAEVEVDIGTGKVTVLRYVTAQDVGRAINPLLLEGQMQGSVYQGMGYILTEGLIFDPKSGATLNRSFADYEVPTILDVPPVESIIVESIEPLGAFGAKGAGEASLTSVAPTIANAIFNAIGVRFYDFPITPDKILEALKNKGRGG